MHRREPHPIAKPWHANATRLLLSAAAALFTRIHYLLHLYIIYPPTRPPASHFHSYPRPVPVPSAGSESELLRLVHMHCLHCTHTSFIHCTCSTCTYGGPSTTTNDDAAAVLQTDRRTAVFTFCHRETAAASVARVLIVTPAPRPLLPSQLPTAASIFTAAVATPFSQLFPFFAFVRRPPFLSPCPPLASS